MTGLGRKLGNVVLLAALGGPAWAATPPSPSTAAPRTVQDDAHATLMQAIDLLERGRREQALAAIQKVLAMDLSPEQAYALWKQAGDDAFLRILVEGGEFELAAKHLLEKTRTERRARRDDAAAIQALVTTVTAPSADPVERRRAVRQLAAEHGEYAVPHLLAMLGVSDDDRRVMAMHTLAQMDRDVVPPLIEALGADDGMLRRSVVQVLGVIGDPRSAPYLALIAQRDGDSSVQAAAREALARFPEGGGDPQSGLLALGNAYHHRHDVVLRDGDVSDVVWSWHDGSLVATPLPRFLYNDEMAKRAYYQALQANPSSVEALAGLARSYASERAKIAMLEAGGQDVGEWRARADEALTAVHAAGIEALDLALRWSVESGDTATGVALARVLGPICNTPCPSLHNALANGDGAIRAEAAVALGAIALRSGSDPGQDVLRILGESAAREVVRAAAVIDPDPARAQSIVAALEGKGLHVSHWTSGVRGLGMLRRLPALDVVLVSESLPDVTAARVIDEVRADERLKAVPIVLIAKSAEEAAGTWGDKIAGTLTNAGDLAAIDAVLAKELAGDRALAADLAQRSAAVLAYLGQGGRIDLSGIVAELGNVVGARPDPIAIPLMNVLGQAGGAAQVPALVVVLADESRSENSRAAAAGAIAGILGRNPAALSAEDAARVQAVASSTAPLAVRDAAARALALVALDPAARAELLMRLRAPQASH